MRHAFVQALCDAAKDDERIFLITGDLGYSILEPFQDTFPDRFLNIGVAEANMITVAAGLSTTGFIPFVYSIVPFATMRPFEQIRNDISFQNRNVKIIGVGGGFAYGKAGMTHHSVEDIALMRTLPRMTIVNPCNEREAYQATKAVIYSDGPVYMRLERNPIGATHDALGDFDLERGRTIKNGKHIALIVTGTKLATAQRVCTLLSSYGIDVAVYAFPVIQPFDTRLLRLIVKKHRIMVTVEEHSIYGGIGTIVAEFFASIDEPSRSRLIRCGVKHTTRSISADHTTLTREHGLSSEYIAALCVKEWKKLKRESL